VNFFLPEHRDRWYNYMTKKEETQLGTWQTRVLSDLDQAIFVRGGSIIPILTHDDCMALWACIDNPIKLEVYLERDGQAFGHLYLDDYWSNMYKDGKYAQVDLTF